MRDTLSAAWYARALLVVPTLLSSSFSSFSSCSSCPRATVRSYQIFSFFFLFFSSPPIVPYASYAATTLPKYRRVPSAGVRPSSSGQSLRGGEGERGRGNRESVVPLSLVPSMNGTTSAVGSDVGFIWDNF